MIYIYIIFYLEWNVLLIIMIIILFDYDDIRKQIGTVSAF